MALERLRMDGQVAIVTGAGRGVGRGIAQVLAEAGAAVVVTARTSGPLDDLVASIRQSGGRAISVAGDVMKRADQERAVAAALETFGRIDILVNNAGGGQFKPFLELTEEDFRFEFEWNVVSAFMLTQIAAPHMLQSGGGCVLNISSRAARYAPRGMTPYGVTKAALEQLTRCMANELSPKIRVNAIQLGTVMTDALQNVFDSNEGLRERMLERTPLHRVGEVEDIGLAALYLCSPKCYATGAVLNVDGGIQQALLDDLPDL